MAVIAEYFCGRDQAHLFIADASGGDPLVTMFSLPPIIEELTAYFRYLSGDESSGAGPAIRSIVEPIVQKTRENEHVWIIPHGILHYLPFHALPTSEDTLGFRNPICYGPSASTLPICRRGPRLGTRNVVTVGDPTGNLPWARREAAWVGHKFDTDPLIGIRATRQALYAALNEAHEVVDILHLACHGRAAAENPLESGVLLASGGAGSGADLLSAGEILRRRLRAALVTISACDAGRGMLESSDEVLGLTRALLSSGASSVVLSAWPLDDLSTYLTVRRFYQELRDMIDAGRGSKASALQRAQSYIHDMTIRNVVAECDGQAARCAATGDSSGELDFAEEAASWAATAGDFEDAIQRLRQLDTKLQQNPSAFAVRHEPLRNRIEELEFRSMLRRQPLVYESKPYENEMNWAGLFLHGDWAL